MLTQKQYELLVYINNYLKEHAIAPSFEEMRKNLGLRSKSGVHRLIRSLIERGFLRQLPNKARALEVVKLPNTTKNKDTNNIIYTKYSAQPSLRSHAHINEERILYIPITHTLNGDSINARNNKEVENLPLLYSFIGYHNPLLVSVTKFDTSVFQKHDILVFVPLAEPRNADWVIYSEGDDKFIKKFSKCPKSVKIEYQLSKLIRNF
jgi:repressor LexA